MVDPRPTLTAMAAVLASYGSALAVEHAAHLHVDIVIVTVVLAMTLARIQRSADHVDRLAGFALLPAVAVLAWATGHLMSAHPDGGDACFVLLMAASIWVRRFGPRAARAGLLIVSPLIAVLITGQGGPGQAGLGWVVLIALIAAGWVSVCQLLAGHPAPPTMAAARPSARRISASTRMALQLGAALTAAFVTGRLLWPAHWSWVVLTAYIVCSGAAGRGDVLLKGVLRAAGAAAGTLVAAGIAGTFGPRADATVVLMFVALAAATWLREFSYAYWAAIVTAVLSLLYDWFGEAPGALLDTRLEGILVGAALGVAASWLILPIRTADVVRRRSADALAVLSGMLAADPADPAALRRGQVEFDQSVALLGRIAQPPRAQRLLFSRWWPRAAAGADTIDAITSLTTPVRAFARAAADPLAGDAVRAVAGNVVAVRLAIGRRTGRDYEAAVVPPDGPRGAALGQIDGALGRLALVLARP